MSEPARLPVEPDRAPHIRSISESTSSVEDFLVRRQKQIDKNEHYRDLLRHLVIYLATANGIYLAMIASIGTLAQFDQIVLSTLTMGTVIGTAVWVGLDAKDRGANGLTAANWALACVTLWLFAFPLYLARRAMSPEVYRQGVIG